MEKYFFGVKDNVLIVMGDYAEYLKKVKLGIASIEELGKQISFELLDHFGYNGIGFTHVDEQDIYEILGIWQNKKYEVLVFNDSVLYAPLSFICHRLFIGERAGIILDSNQVKVLNEVNFLNIKSFKGDIQGVFGDVKRLILFEDSRKLDVNKILPHFPNIEYLFINNSVVVDLDLSFCSHLKELEVHRSRNLETIKFHEDKQVENVITTSCKKLVL